MYGSPEKKFVNEVICRVNWINKFSKKFADYFYAGGSDDSKIALIRGVAADFSQNLHNFFWVGTNYFLPKLGGLSNYILWILGGIRNVV